MCTHTNISTNVYKWLLCKMHFLLCGHSQKYIIAICPGCSYIFNYKVSNFFSSKSKFKSISGQFYGEFSEALIITW